MGVLGWFNEAEAFTEAFYSILFYSILLFYSRRTSSTTKINSSATRTVALEEASKERINLFSLLFVARIFWEVSLEPILSCLGLAGWQEDFYLLLERLRWRNLNCFSLRLPLRSPGWRELRWKNESVDWQESLPMQGVTSTDATTPLIYSVLKTWLALLVHTTRASGKQISTSLKQWTVGVTSTDATTYLIYFVAWFALLSVRTRMSWKHVSVPRLP
jgi:hypothetical protein